jgi:predicted MFS family arabinose efflux permease
MDGIGNIAGWRWIFILEGAITILTGIAVLFFLPDSIERSSWLSHEEKGFLRQRLQ